MPQNATSTKPPAVKAAVLVRYAEGHSKAEIARRLGIDRETVTRILSEPEYKEAIEASRSRCINLLPKAERAVEKQLDDGDGDLGLRVLEKSGVLKGDTPRVFLDGGLQIAIQNLLPSPVDGQLQANAAAEGASNCSTPSKLAGGQDSAA